MKAYGSCLVARLHSLCNLLLVVVAVNQSFCNLKIFFYLGCGWPFKKENRKNKGDRKKRRLSEKVDTIPEYFLAFHLLSEQSHSGKLHLPMLGK